MFPLLTYLRGLLSFALLLLGKVDSYLAQGGTPIFYRFAGWAGL